MTDDVRDIEAWLNEQLMAYATYDGVESAVERVLASAISDLLDDLNGEDVLRINAYVRRTLDVFHVNPVDYDGILNGFIRAVMAAQRGRADLYRLMGDQP